MRIILDKLSELELTFILDLLNSAGAEVDVFRNSRFVRAIVSPDEDTGLDKSADRFAGPTRKGRFLRLFGLTTNIIRCRRGIEREGSK